LSHGLIAALGGDTTEAARAFAQHLGEAVKIIAPVDFSNDSVRTSLEVARALEGRVWGVRLGTSTFLVDRSILPQMGAFDPTGVNPQLVWAVRNALDAEGFGDVKIAVSGGFTVERIRSFEDDGVPVDAYCVGASIFEGRYPFVADVVGVDGTPRARAGREARPNPRLERVK
jgi:nicotinate phosphoribosyltransferase